jgi:deoxycytidylate deaminase
MATPKSKMAKDVVKEALVPVADLFNPSASERISSTHTEEMVIALCGPIGSPLHSVAATLKRMLEDSFGYSACNIIKLSDFITRYDSDVGVTIPETRGFERIDAQISAGNKLREKHGASILAELAVNDIRVGREQQKTREGATHHKTRRICNIIDSIKNQQEMELLRLVYREMVYFVGVSVPLTIREANLREKGLESGEVYRLFDRDSGEESNTGQTVRDTFPQCDFFLRIESDTDAQLNTRVERFLSLILQSRIVTPTPHEAAMYAAASAATNSACLSRQVGAAIVDKNGDLLAVGWNDVPKFGGGLYASDPADPNGEHDKRCWNRDGGKCFNDQEKQLFAEILIEELGEFLPAHKQEEARKRIEACSKLRNLIEFSRSVHAEMHAIINASKLGGGRLVGGTMFVTTYPCHSCARHIIAAGITQVYYIEPYRKSLAIKLHGDAMSEKEQDPGKVNVLSYDGVAPAKYLALFKMKPESRKVAGRLRRVSAKASFPRLDKSLEALPTLEALVVESLARKKLISITSEGPGEAPSTTAA